MPPRRGRRGAVTPRPLCLRAAGRPGHPHSLPALFCMGAAGLGSADNSRDGDSRAQEPELLVGFEPTAYPGGVRIVSLDKLVNLQNQKGDGLCSISDLPVTETNTHLRCLGVKDYSFAFSLRHVPPLEPDF